jgi:hypothetical protein
MPSAFEVWNRKLHIYLGLYFLFFVWLFCLSGVLLDHPKWRIAQFWPERKVTTTESQISPPGATEDLGVARDLMHQLHIRGEVSGSITRTAPGGFSFRIVRPGEIYDVRADLDRRRATVSCTHVNGWGILNMLHSFSGVRRTDPTLRPNWWLTEVWRFSMDALAAGLAVMVLSGIYMWFSRTQRRMGGMIALVLGILAVAAFVASPF